MLVGIKFRAIWRSFFRQQPVVWRVELLEKEDTEAKYLYRFRGRPKKYVENKSAKDYFIEKPQEVQENPCLTLKQVETRREFVWSITYAYPILALPKIVVYDF